MGEERLHDISISVRQKSRNKSVKFRLYLAKQFRCAWSYDIKDRFYPPVPLQKESADEYWNKEHYRIRIDRKWHSRHERRYEFYTFSEVLKHIEDEFE